MIAVFLSSFLSGRTIKIKYEFDEDDAEHQWQSFNPNHHRFMNFLYSLMWKDFGATGFLQTYIRLQFPGCEDYPTHYTIEANQEQYFEFCDLMKDSNNADI